MAQNKIKDLAEIAFKKSWAKKCKLNPDLRTLRKDVGKAPACNTKVRTDSPAISTANKKKKR